MSSAATHGFKASRGLLPRLVPKVRSRFIDWAMHDDVVYEVILRYIFDTRVWRDMTILTVVLHSLRRIIVHLKHL